jgi:hypothetical protein
MKKILNKCPYCGLKVKLERNPANKEYYVLCKCLESTSINGHRALDKQKVIRNWNAPHKPVCKKHTWEEGRCGIVYCKQCFRHPLPKHKYQHSGFITE